MKIFENILDKNRFSELQKYIMGPSFPWYFNNTTCENDEGIYQFTHTIVINGTVKNYGLLSLVDHIISNVLNIKEARIIRSKFNLLSRQLYSEKDLELTIHKDTQENNKNIYSFIYYINDSEGDTIFYDTKNTNIKPKANTGVLFNSYLSHRASPPTKNKTRYILNTVFEVIQY